MAVLSGVFTPLGGSTANSTTADIQGTINATTSSSEIVLSKYMLFAINSTDDMNIRFGNAGMPVASNADFRIPGGTTVIYQMSQQFTRIRLFNATAATITYWIQPMSASL